jgi:hypothetical protein
MAVIVPDVVAKSWTSPDNFQSMTATRAGGCRFYSPYCAISG